MIKKSECSDGLSGALPPSRPVPASPVPACLLAWLRSVVDGPGRKQAAWQWHHRSVEAEPIQRTPTDRLTRSVPKFCRQSGRGPFTLTCSASRGVISRAPRLEQRRGDRERR